MRHIWTYIPTLKLARDCRTMFIAVSAVVNWLVSTEGTLKINKPDVGAGQGPYSVRGGSNTYLRSGGDRVYGAVAAGSEDYGNYPPSLEQTMGFNCHRCIDTNYKMVAQHISKYYHDVNTFTPDTDGDTTCRDGHDLQRYYTEGRCESRGNTCMVARYSQPFFGDTVTTVLRGCLSDAIDVNMSAIVDLVSPKGGCKTMPIHVFHRNTNSIEPHALVTVCLCYHDRCNRSSMSSYGHLSLCLILISLVSCIV